MADVYSNASTGILNFGAFQVDPGGKFKADDVPEGVNLRALELSGHIVQVTETTKRRVTRRGNTSSR